MAKTKFDHRQATPRATFGYTGPDGTQRELVADKDGVVKPETAHDVAMLKGFGLEAVVTPEDEEQAVDDREAIEAEFHITKDGPVPRETKDDKSKPAVAGAEG